MYTYHDIRVFCSSPETLVAENDTATNPTVIFEILLPSTRNYDQSEKFNLNRKIDSLKEYILIDSQAVKVIKHSKNENNSLLLIEYKSIEDTFFLKSIGVQLSLIELNEKVKFV